MEKTDWDEYYHNPSGFSKYTRLYTQNWLIKQIQEISNGKKMTIAEFGGGNSCFHDAIITECPVNSYTIYDNNDVGVKKFEGKYSSNDISKAINCNLLNDEIIEIKSYDIVFSVGLIEHFDSRGTENVVKKHFDAVKSGGTVIITAPTPTPLYNMIRKSSEYLNLWKFHDERPLLQSEMHQCVQNYGTIVNKKLLWAIGLTQYALVIKAK